MSLFTYLKSFLLDQGIHSSRVLPPRDPAKPRTYLSATDLTAAYPTHGQGSRGKRCSLSTAVILYVRNHESTIVDRVHRAQQEYQAVIVLDEGSTDATPHLAAESGAVVILRAPGQKFEAALQKAVDIGGRMADRVIFASD